MPFFLAAIASTSFGVADFLGGLATRRAPAVSIVVTSQLVGGTGIVVAAILAGPVPGVVAWAWGAGAGLAGGVGVVVLYHALATTPMSVTAPVTAVFGTASPVLFGIAIGERPAPLAWLGVVIGLVAIVFIALSPDEPTTDGELRRGIWPVLYGTTAGLAFGLFGILISRTGTESGLWPLVGARVASVGLLVVVALVLSRPIIAPRARLLAAGAGGLDMLANVLFLVAVRQELLSLVTVIMAMYPASTVGLARVVLGERLRAIQILGLAMGVIALGLIVLA